jgi:hypothetical protein
LLLQTSTPLEGKQKFCPGAQHTPPQQVGERGGQQAPTSFPLKVFDWQGVNRSARCTCVQPKHEPLLHTCPGAQQVFPQACSAGQHVLFTHADPQHWLLQHVVNGAQQLPPQGFWGGGHPPLQPSEH